MHHHDDTDDAIFYMMIITFAHLLRTTTLTSTRKCTTIAHIIISRLNIIGREKAHHTRHTRVYDLFSTVYPKTREHNKNNQNN